MISTRFEKVAFALCMSAIMLQCTSRGDGGLSIPEGLSVKSRFTSHLGYSKSPTDSITYLVPSIEKVVVYSFFEGFKVTGSHQYKWVLYDSSGHQVCLQESAYAFNNDAWSAAASAEINVAACLRKPGNYRVHVYLDSNWVADLPLKVLSDNELATGSYAPWWSESKYLNTFKAPEDPNPGDWTVETIFTSEARLMGLWMFPHKEFNRVFALHEQGDAAVLKEATNYGWQDIRVITADEQPDLLQCTVVGDFLYFHNARIQGSFGLLSGLIEKGVELPFKAPDENVFASPSGKHTLTRSGDLDGKSIRTVTRTACDCGEVEWAHWSSGDQFLYFTIDCCGDGPDDIFISYLQTGAINEIGTEFANLPYVIQDNEGLVSLVSGARHPVIFSNNGITFTGFVQTNGVIDEVRLATQGKYPNYSFRPSHLWNGAIAFAARRVDYSKSYITLNTTGARTTYLQYDFTINEGMSGKSGTIQRIGTVADGLFKGREVYTLRDDISYYDDKGSGGYNEEAYLIRDGDELIAINLPESYFKSAFVSFPDLDGNRMRSPLFKGIKNVAVAKDLFITGLLSAPELELPQTAAKLRRGRIDRDPRPREQYRKIYDHPVEGEIFVKQKDDGSFWRFNIDGSATLYTYDYQFEVVIEGTKVAWADYASFTNHDCSGSQLDFAHIINLDPGRVKEASPGPPYEPIYRFTTNQDEILKEEFNALSKAYTDNGETFVEYEEFLKGIPLFLWKDPFGRYIRFIRRNYLAPANCDPVVYFYPEAETDIEVKLGEKVDIIASHPDINDGWNLRATPDGRLIDMTTYKNYDKIFWEGLAGVLPPVQEGFVVDTTDLAIFFDEKLKALGLNEKEVRDFKHAWTDDFKEAPFYFIGFYQRDVIDRYAPMQIDPKPETLIRILMDYRPLTARLKVPPVQLDPAPVRKGFTVVEWAGLKR